LAHTASPRTGDSPRFVADSVAELRRELARGILAIIGGVSLVWLLHLGMQQSWLAAAIVPSASALAFVLGLAWWLLARRFLLAQVWLQAGAGAWILTLAILLADPIPIVLLPLLPLIAGATAGWALASASVVWVSVLVLVAPRFLPLPVIPATEQQIVIVGGVLTGLIGGAMAHTWGGAACWALQRYVEGRSDVQEQQQQRLRLLQAQEDLVHANRELARLTDRLKILTQAAEDARRIKEEFVANVSHELRTPLNMIIGFSEVILKSPRTYGARLPDALLADIRAIQRNSSHLAGLVNDVLALSQAESGKLVLSREWVNLNDLLADSREAVLVLFESKGLYLKLDLPEEPLVIFCDRLRIREVALNLLSNAGRFTEQGGVSIRAWREDGHAVFSVADTGPGIPAKDQQRVFEPFQQLDPSVQRKHAGSGLGLSISRRFVEMHDGKMWLASEVGRGATFYVSLPLEPLADSAPRSGPARWISPYHQHEARGRRPEVPPPLLAPRFLLLEETDQLRRLFQQFAPGIEIVPVSSIPDLVAESRRALATAAVVNTADPQTMAENIRAAGGLPQETPLIICWAPGERDAARELGVLRYLIKPVSQEALCAAVQEVKATDASVLVVDDNPEAVQLFSRMLVAAGNGVRVLRAMDGSSALRLMRERQPDVVLLDLLMPEMDGFHVLREKEKDPAIRQIPVLVVSSRDPTGGAAISNLLSVSRAESFSPQQLLACMRAVSEILSPPGPSAAPTSPTIPPA